MTAPTMNSCADDAAFYAFGQPFEPMCERDSSAVSATKAGAADATFYSFGQPFEPLHEEKKASAPVAVPVCTTGAADAAFFPFGQPFEPLQEASATPTSSTSPLSCATPVEPANTATADAAFYSFGMAFEPLEWVDPPARQLGDVSAVSVDNSLLSDSSMRKNESEIFEISSPCTSPPMPSESLAKAGLADFTLGGGTADKQPRDSQTDAVSLCRAAPPSHRRGHKPENAPRPLVCRKRLVKHHRHEEREYRSLSPGWRERILQPSVARVAAGASMLRAN